MRWSVVVWSFGLGVAVGAVAARPALWVAAVLLVAGTALAVVEWRRSGPSAPNDDGPPLTGVGTRVEEILRLAEQQAEDHRAAARREADEIVAAARLEARRITEPGSGAGGGG